MWPRIPKEYNESSSMRISSWISRPAQYLLAIGLMAAVTAVFYTLREGLDTTVIALLYLIPLGLITAVWGLGPGITCSLLTFLTINYFFIPPYYTLAVHRPTDVVILVVFLVVAVVVSQLVGRMQSGLVAANAREREATQLYELSIALTGLHNDHSIAQILARQVHAVSQGEHVEINITDTEHFSLHLPDTAAPNRPPELFVPIQAARGVLGEILLWKTASAGPAGDVRLLETFASQGGLALERAQLAQAEFTCTSPRRERSSEVNSLVFRFARTPDAAFHHQSCCIQLAG